MTEREISKAPVIVPETEIDSTTKHKLLNKAIEESQVIVHCSYKGRADRIRIWKSTFLYAKDSTHKSKLVHAENITFFPAWMKLKKGQTTKFTLIFTGLPKNCKQFHLIEDIPEPGGFVVRNIERTNSDVYMIDIV